MTTRILRPLTDARPMTVLGLIFICLAAAFSPELRAQANPYQDKVAIITGTSSGLGLELAKLGAEKGMKLVLVDVDPPGSVELANDINADGGEAIFVHADLARHEDRVEVVEAAQDHFERVDYLLNNAGYTYLARLDQMDLDDAHRLFEVNYWAYVDLANQVIPIMKEQGSGTIFNVASILGLTPGSEGQGHYAATKHALVGMFQVAAKELAPHGIEVFVAAPGGMRTNIAKNSVGPLADERRDRAEDWQDPTLPAQDIFEAMQGEEVVFRPGYIGDVPLEQLKQ